jgi:hypothetical protein
MNKLFVTVRLLIAIALAIALNHSSLSGATIPVTNSSFEDYVLPPGFTTGGTGLTGYGWTVSSGLSVGVFHPVSQFPSGVPDGVNVAYSHGATISQGLAAVLSANVSYTLEVDIGDANNFVFGGYRVQLLAGSSVKAEDNNTLVPPNGGFVTSTVAFTALPSDPNLGQQLLIKLVALDAETSFDQVRVDATAVPEPAGLLLFSMGWGVLALRLRFGREGRPRS